MIKELQLQQPKTQRVTLLLQYVHQKHGESNHGSYTTEAVIFATITKTTAVSYKSTAKDIIYMNYLQQVTVVTKATVLTAVLSSAVFTAEKKTATIVSTMDLVAVLTAVTKAMETLQRHQASEKDPVNFWCQVLLLYCLCFVFCRMRRIKC